MTRLFQRRRSWREASFAVLDFETTGLDFSTDEIVSYGVVPVRGGRVVLADAAYQIVRPSMPPPAVSVRVHGLTSDELSTAPELADVEDVLIGLLDGHRLVAHAAGVELGFLDGIYSSHRRRAPRQAIDVLGLAVELARQGGSARPDSPRLADLARTYGVPHARSHHAFSDAFTTALLLIVLASRLEQLGYATLGDLTRAGRSQNARYFSPAPLDRTRPVS